MPVYNDIYVQECLDSLKKQICDIDVLIIDDGCNKATKDILLDSGFKIISQENQGKRYGVAHNLNMALKYHIDSDLSPYWTWISSDNVVYPTCYEELLKSIDKCIVAYSDFDFIEADGKLQWHSTDINYLIHNEYHFTTLRRTNIIGSCFIISTPHSKLLSGFNLALKYTHDYDFFLRMSRIGQFFHVQKILGAARSHEGRTEIGQHPKGHCVLSGAEMQLCQDYADLREEFDLNGLILPLPGEASNRDRVREVYRIMKGV